MPLLWHIAEVLLLILYLSTKTNISLILKPIFIKQGISDVETQNKSGKVGIKKSVEKYLDELPTELKNEFIIRGGGLPSSVISSHIDSLG